MIPSFGIDPSDGWSVWEILKAVALVGGAIGAIAAALKVVAALIELNSLRNAERVRQRLAATASTASFSKDEVKSALHKYVVPECAQSDPSNHTDLRYVADVRENVMQAVDRFISHGEQYRHLLMLADSGMGKTTFCLNYYKRLSRKGVAAAVVPLGRPEAIAQIRRIEVKSDCILLLDALDEDPEALIDAEARIKALMDASADFLAVIITCRSQFFQNDASIPTRTGVSVIRPRRAGEEGEYRFSRLYLLPFSESQVERYIRYSFPILAWSGWVRRGEARKLVKEIPELSVRPMLLALVPDLLRKGRRVHGLYDLYKFMVDSWLDREKNWIAPSGLLEVSKLLAVKMYNAKFQRVPDRVTIEELNKIAKEVGIAKSEWKHLTGRSLLNRDSDGNFKFSHRSVLEYLYVQSAIEGNQECFDYSWTDMMRDLFVSWGHTQDGKNNDKRAQEILALDLTKLGLAPLASPLPRANTIRVSDLKAILEGGRSLGRRIPTNWRPQSIRISKQNNTFVVRDLQFDLEWTIPDASTLDETLLLSMIRSQAEAVHGGMRLPSAEEFLSLVDVDSRVADQILDQNIFYWLGDKFGRSRYLIASLGPAAVPHASLKLIGRSEVRGNHGSAWFYEVASLPKSFGDKVAEFSARVLSVKPGDSGLYRKLAMMSPEEYDRHIQEVSGQLELILSQGVSSSHEQAKLATKPKSSRQAHRARAPRT